MERKNFKSYHFKDHLMFFLIWNCKLLILMHHFVKEKQSAAFKIDCDFSILISIQQCYKSTLQKITQLFTKMKFNRHIGWKPKKLYLQLLCGKKKRVPPSSCSIRWCFPLQTMYSRFCLKNPSKFVNGQCKNSSYLVRQSIKSVQDSVHCHTDI